MLIRTSLQPGDIGELVRLHGVLYAEEYNLNSGFEGYVAEGLGKFVRANEDERGRIWIAESEARIVGSIAIVRLPERVAQLRWFLVHPEARGLGLGQRLIAGALEYCRELKARSVFLWTLNELSAAAHLYRRAGFCLTEQKTHEIWGTVRTEERYDLTL
jgi:N-acetylglutamate synthase-like GNAT family acetyltransferase